MFTTNISKTQQNNPKIFNCPCRTAAYNLFILILFTKRLLWIEGNYTNSYGWIFIVFVTLMQTFQSDNNRQI